MPQLLAAEKNYSAGHVRVSEIWVPVRRDSPKMIAHHLILVDRASCPQRPRDCNYGGKGDHAPEADQHDLEIIAWNLGRPTPPSRVSWVVRWDKKSDLFFLTTGNQLMKAELNLSAQSLQVKSLRPLSHTAAPLFDVTADGQRVLAVTPARAESSSISLLLNWPALLNK